MHDLIPPHGGLSEPVDRQVPAAEQADFRKRAAGLKKLPVSVAEPVSTVRPLLLSSPPLKLHCRLIVTVPAPFSSPSP